MFRNPLASQIRALIAKCRLLGLPEQDCVNANEFLQYHEYALAFDTILTLMYEFDIPINAELYEQIETIARRMSLEAKDYSFMAELIRPVV